MPIALRLRGVALVTALSAICLLAAAVPASAGQRTISMVDDRFSPASVTVQVGDIVRWVNNGNKPHTVTSRTNLFDSGIVQTGKSFAHTFSKAGTYRYYCFLHSGMNGTITVRTASTPRPTPRPTARPGRTGQPRSTKRPAVHQPDTAVLTVDGTDEDGGSGGPLEPALLVLMGTAALGVTLLGQRRMRAAREWRRRL